MPTVASDHEALTSIFMGLGLTEALRREELNLPPVATAEERIQQQIRLVNTPSFIQAALTAQHAFWAKRGVVVSPRYPQGTEDSLPMLRATKQTALWIIRRWWPHLLRRSKVGLRKILRAYFTFLNQEIHNLAWASVEDL
jgi:hypothetical protein